MSFPRNAATPKAFAVGPLVKVADGSLLAVTTGVNVRYQLDSGGWGAGGGTIAVDATSGVFTYAPLQAETNGDVLNVVLYIAGYVSATATMLMDPIGIPAIAPGSANGLQICGTNAATTYASMTITGAQTNGSTVFGNTTMGTLTQTGAVSWGATTFATLTVTGATLFTTTVTVGTNLLVSGTTTLTGNVTLSGTLGTGAVTFASMAVTGALSVGTTTTLTGAVVLGASLYVTTTTTLHGNVGMDGTLTVTGTTTHTGAVTLTNGINVGAMTGTGFSTLTQSQVSGGAYDLTNATFVAALKTGLGKVPATVAAGDGVDAAALLTATGVR